MYKVFLLKYGEIGVKGDNRHIFEGKLAGRVKAALAKCRGNFNVYKENGRIFAEISDEAFAEGDYDYDEIIAALKKVFGLVWICPVVQIETDDFEEIVKKTVECVDNEYKTKDFTFKVEARRAKKSFPLNSMEINVEVGARLLAAFPSLKVDVHNPAVTVNIEIRNKVNIYSVSIAGPGGLPVGSSGNATLLLSGGIDSPVAGYMTAKRGVCVSAVYFHAPPYTSERAKQKVVDLAEIMSSYTGSLRLHIINFTDIQLEIYKNCPPDEMTIIMRRFMYKIAEKIAEKEEACGLITGESIGQVASQTLQSMYCTNAAASLPVYRPLIAMDKQDIIDIAQKIGTYETSIQPFEDCCTIFVAKHPVTKPKLNVIENDESKLSEIIVPLIDRAIDEEEIVVCGK